MKKITEEWGREWQRARPMFAEALAFFDEGVTTALVHLPALEQRPRGSERMYRYPEQSVNVALMLKLVQLRGNIYTGTLLLENDHFLEWDVIQRIMQDAHEDVRFLVLCERDREEIVSRYLENFFDEDIDDDGELTNRRRVRGVERQEVRQEIKRAERALNLTDQTFDYEAESRKIHRVRSGSVHGRAASILRANVVETTPGQAQLWLGGERTLSRTKLAYRTLLLEATMTVASFLLAGASRWWDDELAQRASGLFERMREMTDGLN